MLRYLYVRSGVLYVPIKIQANYTNDADAQHNVTNHTDRVGYTK